MCETWRKLMRQASEGVVAQTERLKTVAACKIGYDAFKSTAVQVQDSQLFAVAKVRGQCATQACVVETQEPQCREQS